MILFACPNPACRKRHRATDEAAGEVFECDGADCGYHVIVPAPPEPPAPVLGEALDEETGATVMDWRTDPPPAPVTRASRPSESRRTRPATLVDEPKPKRRSKRRSYQSGFRCPFCDTDELPRATTRISTGGWVVFAVLLVFFFPLFWVGLLLKEENRVCRDCGVRLDG